MSKHNIFTQIPFMVFNRIALAHCLIDNEHRYKLDTNAFLSK